MNRAERRSLERGARKMANPARAVASVIPPSVVCLTHGHDYPDTWTIRPAWIGAGVSIPKVHFDRQCRRCKHNEHVWSDVVGDRTPRAESMTLREWLESREATVQAPPGTVHFPLVAEVERLRRAEAKSRGQSRA